MKNKNIYEGQKEAPFEMLNTINVQKKNTNSIILGLFVVCGLMLVTLLVVANKPPLVIRIDKLGNTEVLKDYTFETKTVADDDIKSFTTVFLKNYVGLRSDLVVAQFQKSLNMMTDDFSKNHLKSMKENNTVRSIQAAGVRNNVILEKIEHEDAGKIIYVSSVGKLETRPIDDINAVPQSKTIDADLVLIKTKRTADHPYGLLLQDIKIAINKDVNKIENNINEVINAH